jgi:hypothetical protein
VPPSGDHKMPLVIFGLLVSIPIIVWGSQLVIKLMDRFPTIIVIGGMLLGWIAGTMARHRPGRLPRMPVRDLASPAPHWSTSSPAQEIGGRSA